MVDVPTSIEFDGIGKDRDFVDVSIVRSFLQLWDQVVVVVHVCVVMFSVMDLEDVRRKDWGELAIVICEVWKHSLGRGSRETTDLSSGQHFFLYFRNWNYQKIGSGIIKKLDLFIRTKNFL